MSDSETPKTCRVCGLPPTAENGDFACPGCDTIPPSTNVPNYTHKERTMRGPSESPDLHQEAVQSIREWHRLQEHVHAIDHHLAGAECGLGALRVVRSQDAEGIARAEAYVKKTRATLRLFRDMAAQARTASQTANTALAVTLLSRETGSPPEGNA